MRHEDISTALNNIGWFRRPSFVAWFFRYRNRLKVYKDRHKGESCFIIGNGPSLNDTDLSQLKGCKTFGLNKIHLIFDKQQVDISYHVSVNSIVIEQSWREFASLGCPSFLSYLQASKCVVDNKNFNYLYYGLPFTFREDITWPLHEGHTVTYVAMQIAYYMGFKEVYLIGVDHNFKFQGSPNERQYLSGDDPNHFDPDYFAGKEWHLPDLEASEMAYHLANYFYKKDGRRIFDATLNGKLNIFPKITFEEAVRRCKR